MLPLLAPRPVDVEASDRLQLDATVQLGALVDSPPSYELQVRVIKPEAAAATAELADAVK